MNPTEAPFPGRSIPWGWRSLVLSTVAAALAAGCGPARSPSLPASATAPQEACIPSEKGGCLPVAPASARVDLARPTFSHPTDVTNPLHPSSGLHSAVMLGRSGGEPFRTEITLLPGTKTIQWNGQAIEALESQYVAYVDGRIEEVALDWYAQADDGSVWYLGEDVFNYQDGVVADTAGTWQAGRDGPGAMIMPADPRVGDVYRPENIPGIVFEEVTVQETGMTVDGPAGPVSGAISVQELHMDGLREDKIFAPGYGEFSTGAGDDLEALALGVPTDSLEGPVPSGLRDMFQAALAIDDSAQAANRTSANESLDRLSQAWASVRAGGTPAMLEERMRQELEALTAAVDSQDPAGIRQAALRAGLAALDFQLRYRAPTEVDRARFGVWLRQLRLDLEEADMAGVAGDAATLEWIRDRFAHDIPESESAELGAALAELRSAIDDDDATAASVAAGRLADLATRLGDEG